MQIRLRAVLPLSLLLSACGSPPFGGVVRSGNGQPIPGAAVSIEGSPAITTTDASGRYTLEVPAGNLDLRFRRDGFTTESLRVIFSPGEAYRAADVTLYPLPPQGAEGVHWVGPSGLLGLRPARLECRGSGSGASRTDDWVVGGDPESAGPLPTLPAGRSSFVVRGASEPVLVRVEEAPGKVLLASRVVSSWGIELGRQESIVAFQATRAGKEGLLVLSADLAPGTYLWRDTTRNDPFPPKPEPSGTLFRVVPPGGRARS